MAAGPVYSSSFLGKRGLILNCLRSGKLKKNQASLFFCDEIPTSDVVAAHFGWAVGGIVVGAVAERVGAGLGRAPPAGTSRRAPVPMLRPGYLL